MPHGPTPSPSDPWRSAPTGDAGTWPSSPPAAPPTPGWPTTPPAGPPSAPTAGRAATTPPTTWGAPPPPWGGPPPTGAPARPPAPATRGGGWGAIAATFVVTAVVVAVLVTFVTGGGRFLDRAATTAAPTRPVPTQPSSGSGSSGTGSSGSGSATPGGKTSPSTSEPSTSQEEPSSWAEVASLVNPGVVNIESRLPTGIGAGTGMVLTADGEILTNNHVVEDATAIEVTLVATGDVYRATVVGTDAKEDVAVLQLEDASDLATIPLGDSDDVEVGDEVAAIGNAGGKGGDPTVAAGKVVGLGRTITASDETGQNVETLHNLIQVDANVQPGDSGGPLADATGKVVGMDTAAATSAGGRGRTRSGSASGRHEGYAIPINHALDIAEQLKAGTDPNGHSGSAGSSTAGRAILGVQVRTGTDGALVLGVEHASGAATAGITAGDTIVAVDGVEITGPRDLLAALAEHQPGDEVSVEWVTADGEQQQADVTLGQS